MDKESNDIIKIHYGNEEPKRDCLDHGFVRLVDCMPRVMSQDYPYYTCDHAIAQAARVSYGAGTKTKNEDKGLIRYLMRHQHWTPFEMCELKFHCKLPIYVARQWIRHRTANVNEMSGRYSVMESEFHIIAPDEWRMQSEKSKQVSEGQMDLGLGTEMTNHIKDELDGIYNVYEYLLEQGVGREQARVVLPLNLYTQWYWKIDLRNLLNFLSLRCHDHAQKEIRVYADAMLDLITPLFPIAIEAWKDYHPMQNGMLLTNAEVATIREALAGNHDADYLYGTESNKYEQAEWNAKKERLGL